ncbi:isoleucine--tRNA ligase [Puniceicoccales bacterium CK1056]|uniref:Isoleucine--tRNA ligase n=1 Tax=Oceanipulchritudo coccoides TaxID=2706888 RepID=A0A6B2M329_9BACT|nr:isoleucine--tRNA ligase [Oceanipulchritudo coccoides]NDV62816.1 isoleucine--tRNA ligase [Oceanipulchritudo coccoides]
MATELKDTLNLPKTQFPMRGNLAAREPELFSSWDGDDLYGKILEHRASGPTFILHDGPPYANGDIHMGHALNKILKDFVIRYKSMRGFKAPYVPGWDCHGLPIEQQILKQIGDKIHDMDPQELRQLCHKYALGWIDKQRTQFKRLGILGDWDTPYATVTHMYEGGILKVLLALVEKNLIRKGHKAVHWDPIFRTALAEAEIEYHTHKSPSIYVAMPLLNPETIAPVANLKEVSLVIWTTTPWTMPANLGVCLHPEFDYVAVKVSSGAHYVVAKELLESFKADTGLEEAEVVATFKATDFDRAKAAHPIFEEAESLVMLGEHVTLEQGTGCVHTAPGHGADDFIIGKAYGLPVFCPVDDKGCYTEEFPEMEGIFVFDANPKVVELLDQRGLLLGHKTVEHEYPYSWRSKHPIIFRATEQWFMELADGGVREKALELINNDVEWIPGWGRERIRGMVERRPEWCISRQRHWGVPIPSIRDLKTGESVLNADVIRNFIELVSKKGTDAWYTEPLGHFLPPEMKEEDYEKEFDILDVWFDSGASHVAVLEEDERLHAPADLYLEGSDQHRGWFQHALLTSVGARDCAPFKSVLTHGFVLDGEGKAMSKSQGNVISPLELIKTFGSDILRLWVASIDYRNDVAISPEIIKITADTYRTIRNTIRFQLGNLCDFKADEHLLAPEDLTPLDQWALNELAVLADSVTEAYEKYEFHRVYQLLNRFYTVTLSARYHDFLKDRLYTFRTDCHERRSAQTVIYHHIQTLNRLWAPILVFTCDEALNAGLKKDNGLDSIHMEDWPSVPGTWRMEKTASEVEQLLEIRDAVNEKLEALRSAKKIGKSVEAALTLSVKPDSELARVLENYSEQLAELYIVSTVKVIPDENSDPVSIDVSVADGERCPRCWRTVTEQQTTSFGAVCPRCADALTPFVEQA